MWVAFWAEAALKGTAQREYLLVDHIDNPMNILIPQVNEPRKCP